MKNELRNLIEENLENTTNSVELRAWEDVKETVKYALEDDATQNEILLTWMLVREKRKNAKNYTEWIWADVENMLEEF